MNIKKKSIKTIKNNLSSLLELSINLHTSLLIANKQLIDKLKKQNEHPNKK